MADNFDNLFNFDGPSDEDFVPHIEDYLFTYIYILDDDTKEPRHPVNMDEYNEWCVMVGGISVRVAYDEIGSDCSVSTVFLSIDHSHWGGTPVLYETMVFGGPHNELQRRYHTKREALAGHQQLVANLRGGSHN